MINFKRPSARIAIFITLFPLISLSLYGVLSQYFFVNTQQKLIEQDISKMKDYMMEVERNNLREKVENLTLFAKYHNNKNITKSKKNIKEVIYFAADIANNLYQRNKREIEEAQLKEIIITALQNTNFGENIDYLFLQDLKGNALIHRDGGLINTNTINLKDVNGKYIIKEFNKIIEDKQEGFASYFWYDTPDNKDSVYSKLTFIKRLEAYDWFIGAGERLENISTLTRSEILAYIKDNAIFKDGYFFISDAEGKTVFKPLSLKEGLAKKASTGAFYQDEEHLSYTLYVPQFNWHITAVKDLCSIQDNIAAKKRESEKNIEEEVRINFYLIALSWFVSLLLSLYLSLLIFKMLKRYKLALNNANKKLIFQSRQATIGELLPMIAHQWRQPINRIASTLALIRYSIFAKQIDTRKIDEQCFSIEQNIEFMSETIDDFTTFYQPKENKTEADLKELVHKSLAFLDKAIHDKAIAVKLRLESIKFELYGNELMQVLINLIENAVEAAPTEHGIIAIDLYRNKAGRIILSVEDNGEGVSELSLLKVFEPYFSTKEGSMGLGLYMSKMIVEKHLNGQIRAESLSCGARFVISL